MTATSECFPAGKIVVFRSGSARARSTEPLSTRGWTFQEWVFSKRTIHLSKDQVRWQCSCFAASGKYPEGLDKDDLINDGIITKDFIQGLKPSNKDTFLWGAIREEYSQKILTVAKDRFPAFSGIARMSHKVMNSPSGDYLAGLWNLNLLFELLWEKISQKIPANGSCDFSG